MGFDVGGGNREDLLDMISNIDPWETPAFTSFPKTRAQHVLHEWLTDTLPATSTAGGTEGADFSADDADARTRVQNYCQIFRRDFKVTNTQRAVNPAGIRDEYAYQVQKSLKALARNIEAKLFAASGAASTGTTGDARVMKGLDDYISTNLAVANATDAGFVYFAASTSSATAITEDRFNVMLQKAFDNGGNPDKCFVASAAKRQISAFSGQGASRRNIAMTEKKLVASVDVYDSDFGLIQIVLDRWVYNPATVGGGTQDHTDLRGTAYFLESGMQRIAFLRPIRHVPLAPVGDATRGMVLGELTLEVLNQKASARLYGVSGLVE